MKKTTSLLAIAAALALTAGCAHRRTPDQLPPEPPSSIRSPPWPPRFCN